ncbi:MAG: hypothetical protein NT107_02450 [Planctomycetota bacterium]|nr:hypothetical protein [Planctomycetota bacterium]
MRSLFVLGCVVFPCPVLVAQAQDIYLTNGNVQCGIEFNSTPLVYAATGDVLRADPAGDPAGVLFKTAWAYRLNNDTREFIFNDGGGQASYINAGPVGFATWANVDSRGLISALAFYQAISTGPTSGALVCRMQITNISAQPVILSLFHLSDIDDCGAAYLSNISTGGSTGHQFHTGSCGETADQFAAGADRWEAGSYTNVPVGNVDLYTRLEDTVLYDLANTQGSVGPYDIRSAFQWINRPIQPGQSETYTIELDHNRSGRAFGFDRFGTGRAGAFGVPLLSSIGDAQLGTTVTPTVSNCPAFSLVVMELGFTRTATPIADLFNYVGGGSNFVTVSNAAGVASLPISIPNIAGFNGINMFGEGFVFDVTTTSTSGISLTHTVGGQWVFGSY